MSTFKEFRDMVHDRMAKLEQDGYLFFTSTRTRDEVWDAYLNAYPEGTNEVFRERRSYDCNNCAKFVRRAGNLIAINETGDRTTVWDVAAPGYYGAVAASMHAFIGSAQIEGFFIPKEANLVGVESNMENPMIYPNPATWRHFYYNFKVQRLSNNRGTLQNNVKSQMAVLRRAMEETSLEAAETVRDLILENSLYRGDEFLSTVKKFMIFKNMYLTSYVGYPRLAETWLWWHAAITRNNPYFSSFRNSSIGTLMADISEGVELEVAVKKYESKVAPENYQRPKPLVTEAMKKRARATAEELGIGNSLGRRMARIDDLTINNVLYADREAEKAIEGDVFDLIGPAGEVADIDTEKLQEISMDKFLSDFLPETTSIELYMENRLESNLVTLVAPVVTDSKPLFKWNNGFSWSYNGNLADSSIKESVKKRGGNVEGDVRFSIMWSGPASSDDSDLDAHCKFHGGHIYYSNPNDGTGSLDIDIQSPKSHRGKDIVENITFPNINRMKSTVYEFKVHQYAARSSQGFTAELEILGELYTYTYPKPLPNKSFVPVVRVTISNGKVVDIKHDITPSSVNNSKEIWGMKTGGFYPVKSIMLSPNHWDGNEVGNKHFFFMINGCEREDVSRGFFNEFLRPELKDHRKVFEALGGLMQVESVEPKYQLSGVGLSNTKDNFVVVKLKGKLNKVIKLTV